MYEIAKHEFVIWINSIEHTKFTEYEKTMLNIIINDFDKIAALSTARGGRAKYLGEKISQLKNRTIEDIPKLMIDSMNTDKIDRIESLKVENFRGFGGVQTFKFNKKYTFFHGPNGAGKTSFCEALEYGILGTIEEATSRGISLDKYILHAGRKKAEKPVIMCKYSSGVIKQCEPNYNEYRFGFLEKNRIEGFSHIGAANARTQTERMAALFGLSEFQEFVRGFSETIDEKYLNVSEQSKIEYLKATENKDNLLKQINETESTIEPIKNKINKIIVDLGCKEITDYNEAIKYLTNSENGIIIKYTKEASENKCIILDYNEFLQITKITNSLINCFEIIQKNNADILSDVGSMNLIDFYNSILKVKRENYCPACHTPLEHVVSNPFELAEVELEKFTRIEKAKKMVKDNAKIIAREYVEICNFVNKMEKTGLIDSIKINAFENKNIQISDLETLDDSIKLIFEEVKKLKVILDNTEELKDRIVQYNYMAEKNNKIYDSKLNKVQEIYKNLVELNSQIETKNENILMWKKQISHGNEKLEELKIKAETEEKNIVFIQKMIEAYKSIVKMLGKYVSELPVNLANNLAEKVKEYYNFINCGDAQFELINELKLPIMPNEKIIIKMVDGIEQDALQILSEGHVKILGLSILLAKAMYEKSPFLIFDDIVNSIDDDHRDGVAKLLITNVDFANTQMILTCHGEIFVSKLEDYVTNQKDMDRYMFLPADSLDERGVFIKYQDPFIPLQNAREKYEEGSLKETAAKCRQAVECIMGKLWKKLVPYSDGGIKIKLRIIDKKPDLYNITTALYGLTKGGHIQGIEQIHKDLENLIKKSNWDILNKGTHIDDSIPEFNRNETKGLLELLEKLAKEVDDLKIGLIVKEL